jgi:hypothetical protein
MAIAYACAAMGKDRSRLTVRDLALARTHAFHRHHGDVARTLQLLLESRSLRDLYCGRGQASPH